MGEGAKVGDRPKQVSSDSHYVATLMLQGVAEGIAQLVRALGINLDVAGSIPATIAMNSRSQALNVGYSEYENI